MNSINKILRVAGVALVSFAAMTLFQFNLNQVQATEIPDEIPPETQFCEDDKLDFEHDAEGNDLAPGTIITNQLLGVTVSVVNNNANHPQAAILFDSENPTGGDSDLATPGGIDNNDHEYNILIIPEDIVDGDGDNLVDDPNDENAGGVITFDFDGPQTVYSVKLIDIETEEIYSIRSYDASGSLLDDNSDSGSGDNSANLVEINQAGVSRLEIELSGSGGVAFIEHCPDMVCYRLHNHPDGGVAPPFYGMRLDELFDVTEGHDIFTFDFDFYEDENRGMFIKKTGSRIDIFGHAFGGHDIGNAYTSDTRYVGLVKIEFTYDIGVGFCINDDDMCVDTDNNANFGSITTYYDEFSTFSLVDERNGQAYSFRLGDEDNDNGHRGFQGISGWGWMNHSGESHISASDWLFTAEPFSCDEICFDDVDEDTYISEECGGIDCDDLDPGTHPDNFDGKQFAGYPAAEVVSATNNSDPSVALTYTEGAPEGSFYTIGFGGELIVRFDCPVQNGDGDDLLIYGVNHEGNGEEPNGEQELLTIIFIGGPEEAEVFAWDDETDQWVFLGIATNQNGSPDSPNNFDLGDLSETSLIRIVPRGDDREEQITDSISGNFNVNGILALQMCGACDEIDNDCDGLIDEDGDHDNDGIPNCSDNCPLDENEDQADTDADGVGDVCDLCAEDPLKTAPGICGCGVSDEADADGDGVPDCRDLCPDDEVKVDSEGQCGCGRPEADDDEDGVPDCVDNCPPSNKLPEFIDLAAFPDLKEAFEAGLLDNINTSNPDQLDTDGDGIGDVCVAAAETELEADPDDTTPEGRRIGGGCTPASLVAVGQPTSPVTTGTGWLLFMLMPLLLLRARPLFVHAPPRR